MIIHSVAPIDMLIEPMSGQNLVTKPFEHGYLTGYSSENGFVISNVISTDPKVYLNDNFSPGKIYKF